MTDAEWYSYASRFFWNRENERSFDASVFRHPARFVLESLRGRHIEFPVRPEFISSITFDLLPMRDGYDSDVQELGILCNSLLVPVGMAWRDSIVLVGSAGQTLMISVAANGVLFVGRQFGVALERIITYGDMFPVRFEGEVDRRWRMAEVPWETNEYVDPSGVRVN